MSTSCARVAVGDITLTDEHSMKSMDYAVLCDEYGTQHICSGFYVYLLSKKFRGDAVAVLSVRLPFVRPSSYLLNLLSEFDVVNKLSLRKGLVDQGLSRSFGKFKVTQSI
jgi:hypothetical protein